MASPAPPATPTSSSPPLSTSQGSQMSEESTILMIKRSLRSEARNATFAVGGQIAINTSGRADKKVPEYRADTVSRTASPVHIRFGESGKGTTLTLPHDHVGTNPPPGSLVQGGSSVSHEVQQLLAWCVPASFGRAGEEVHDESYRNAGKLDATAFATSFCPYNVGIIDVVQQILMPYRWIRKGNRGIRAELYNLNVYSGPSGLFKSHVDTPRDKLQIGSLVVGLPSEHQGGQLVVRHSCEGIAQEQVFDWSQSSADTPMIHWAAFYSDCEHEVLEVKSGHRITLTYNLFATTATGHLAGKSESLDPTQLPLYRSLDTALASRLFLPQGKILAVYLAHNYGHTSATDNFLPHSLKGPDMVLYEVACALGLKTYLRPFLNDPVSCRTLLGAKFLPFDAGKMYDDDDADMMQEWSSFLDTDAAQWREDDVIWLNYPMDFAEAAQAVFPVYGNKPEVDIMYTSAVMLIKVPAYGYRGSTPPENEDIFEHVGVTPNCSDEGPDDDEDMGDGGVTFLEAESQETDNEETPRALRRWV